MSKVTADVKKKIDDQARQAVALLLMSIGAGVGGNIAEVRPKKPKIDFEVGSLVIDRYTASLTRALESIFHETGSPTFEGSWHFYFIMRGRQIGSKCARMMSEFGRDTIDRDIFELAAAQVEAESKNLKSRFEKIIGSKLDVACP